MLSSRGPRALCADNLPRSHLCPCKTNHLGLCGLRHAAERQPAILFGFGKYPPLINVHAEAADADLKAGLTHRLPAEWRQVRWWNQQSMGRTAPGPGPVNHRLIYAKQENKLRVPRSIFHPLSASKGLQLTSTPYGVHLDPYSTLNQTRWPMQTSIGLPILNEIGFIFQRFQLRYSVRNKWNFQPKYHINRDEPTENCCQQSTFSLFGVFGPNWKHSAVFSKKRSDKSLCPASNETHICRSNRGVSKARTWGEWIFDIPRPRRHSVFAGLINVAITTRNLHNIKKQLSFCQMWQKMCYAACLK